MRGYRSVTSSWRRWSPKRLESSSNSSKTGLKSGTSPAGTSCCQTKLKISSQQSYKARPRAFLKYQWKTLASLVPLSRYTKSTKAFFTVIWPVNRFQMTSITQNYTLMGNFTGTSSMSGCVGNLLQNEKNWYLQWEWQGKWSSMEG